MVKTKVKCPDCDGDGIIVVPSRKDPSIAEQAQCERCLAQGYLEDVMDLSEEDYELLLSKNYVIEQKEGYVKASKEVEGFLLEVFQNSTGAVSAQFWNLGEDGPEVGESFGFIKEAIEWLERTTLS